MIKVKGQAILLLVALGSVAVATAAEPPGLINYQGVLRDDQDQALDGSYDMVFRLYDTEGDASCQGGTLLLTDAHLASGTGAVVVTGGLFNAGVGSGDVTPGTEASLSAVFRDHEAVYLHLEVEGESLCPRIRALSAGYSLNADNLDGRNSSFFLNTSGSAQEKTGLLLATGGVDYGPGASDDLTASDVATLTSGGSADVLHSHSSVPSAGNADTLDGLDGSQFLRSDTSDVFTTGTLTIANAATLDVGGQLHSPQLTDRDNAAYYLDPNSTSVLWDLRLNGLDLFVNYDGPDFDSGIWFYEAGNPMGETFFWDDTADRFEMTDELALAGSLQVGSLAGTLVAYSRFGTSVPDNSFYFTSPSDLLVGGDVEIDGTAFVDGDLYVSGNEVEDDDSIYFDIGTVEHLTWDDSQSRFEFSDELAVYTIQAGSVTADPVAWNRMGTGGTPLASAINNQNDLYVRNHLEVGTEAYFDENIIVGEASPSSTQDFSSFGEAAGKDEASIDSFSDVFIAGDMEIEGTLYTPNISDWVSVTTMIDNNNNQTTGEARWYHDGSTAAANQLAELQEDGDFRIRGTLYQNVTFDIAEAFLASEPLEPGDLVRVDPLRPDAVRLTTGAGDPGVLGVVSTRPGIVLGGAPFDVASLREAWGDEVHLLFDAEMDRLREEVLSADPELRTELREIDSLESPDSGTLEPGASGQAITADVPAAELERRVKQAEALADQREVRRANVEAEIESRALEIFASEHMVPVALAGRVPVKVDAAHSAILPGDSLAPGPVPGVAVKATEPGPVIGIALEALDSGQGQVLAFVVRSHLAPVDAAGPLEDEQASVAGEENEDVAETVAGTQTLSGHLQVVLDSDADDESRFSVFRDGKEDELGAEVFRVDEQGNVFAQGSFRPAAMDVAEYHPVSETVGAGDVLVADRERPGTLRLGQESADPAVVGIVSSEPGVLLGSGMGRIASIDSALAEELEQARARGDDDEEARLWKELEEKFQRTHAAIALTGTLPCKVDAGYGAIQVGDLLTTSPTAGHAMRADDPQPGTILGKALEPLDTGTGLIKVLVMLR